MKKQDTAAFSLIRCDTEKKMPALAVRAIRAALFFAGLLTAAQGAAGIWTNYGWLWAAAGAAALVWQSVALGLPRRWLRAVLPLLCLVCAAVFSGRFLAGAVTVSSAAPLIAAGRVRAIAVTAPARVASLPDVPTMAEQGLAGFAVEQWHGLLAPAATPEPVIARLHQMLTQILAEPEMQQALREQGYTPAGESAAQFGKLIAADIERYAAVTAQLGLTVD